MLNTKILKNLVTTLYAKTDIKTVIQRDLMKSSFFAYFLLISFSLAAQYNSPITIKKPKQSRVRSPRIKPIQKQNTTQTVPPMTDDLAKRGILAQLTYKLVHQGINFFNTHSLEETCNAFTQKTTFSRGEVTLFLLDNKGNYWASGEESSHVLWKNIKEVSDNESATVNNFIDAVKSDGWFHYFWRNASRIVYVQEVEKDGRHYFLGGGFYSFSPADQVVSLVKKAVALFEDKKERGRPDEDAFGDMSYPYGQFINGDLYLFSYDFDGNVAAHGEDPNSIGTNQLNEQDQNGKYMHREMIEKAKNSATGVWVEYIYKGEQKRSYIEKIKGINGKDYIIGSGYYPGANRKALVELVDRGYDFLKTVGVTEAAQAFTNPEKDDFRRGNLYLFIYDLKGNCLAHGKSPTFVGKNYYNAKNEHGQYYIQELIKQATIDGSWVNFQERNSIESIYVKLVDLGVDKFIIGGGIFPTSKAETMILVTESAANYLARTTTNLSTIFSAMSHQKNNFVRGDIEIFIFSPDGYCYIYGDHPSVIWDNFISNTDDAGRPYVKMLLHSAQNGNTRMKYKLNGLDKEAYAISIKKNNKTYIIGTSTYLYGHPIPATA